jgi:hypothetical protein
MLVVRDSQEAGGYGADIRTALTRGGWTIDSIDPSENAPEGISIDLQEPSQNTQSQQDVPKPHTVLQQALQAAHVRVNRMASGSAQTTTKSTLSISIGHRKMDDGELTSRRRRLDEYRRMLEETEQDQ